MEYNCVTPWNRNVLETLTVSPLVRKFPSSYGTQRFIIAITIDQHISSILSQTTFNFFFNYSHIELLILILINLFPLTHPAPPLPFPRNLKMAGFRYV
jgi:hypothetical protein